MNYSTIKYNDDSLRLGVRTVLSVCGCNHDCLSCDSPLLCDPNYGQEFTRNTLTDIVKSLDNDNVNGLVIKGGDPLYPQNRESICSLTRTLKAIFGKAKSIILYTGYTIQEIQSFDDPYTNELLNYIDIIIDGRDSVLQKRKRCYEVVTTGDSRRFRELYIRV